MPKKTLRVIVIVFCAAAVLAAVTARDTVARQLFLAALRYKCHAAGHPAVLVQKNRWLFYKEEYNYCFQKLPQNWRVIKDFSLLLASRGIRLIVVPVPDKIEVYPERICGFSVREVVPGRQLLITKLATVGVEVIDLLPLYREAKRSNQLFMPDDTHWTQPAIDIAAHVIGDCIRKHVSPLEFPVRTYHLKQITIPDFLGDLAARSVSDSLTYVHPYHCTSVMLSDTQPYRDTVDSPVLIIGDSFAFCREHYSAHIGAHIAAAIGFPVTMYAKIGGSTDGPQMLRFKSRRFIEKRKVVVWIFASRLLYDRFLPPALPE
jgi:hypothetical protein